MKKKGSLRTHHMGGSMTGVRPKGRIDTTNSGPREKSAPKPRMTPPLEKPHNPVKNRKSTPQDPNERRGNIKLKGRDKLKPGKKM